MCIDHDHIVNISTDEFNNLCFKHAILEALQGREVSLTVETYKIGVVDCDVCEDEQNQKRGN